MKVLVTGASSPLGYHIIDVLSRRHLANILAIDEVKTEFSNNKVNSKILNLKNVDKLASFSGGCEAIIHLQDSQDPEINISNITCLTKAMKKSGVSRLINLSSYTVYGNGQYGMSPLDEQAATIYTPVTFYSASKLIQETIANQFAKENSSRVISIRPGIMIGPKTNIESPINKTIKSFLTEGVANYLGNSREEFDFVHIYDVRDLIISALSHIDLFEAEAFNAGSGRCISIRDLLCFIAPKLDAQIYFDEIKSKDSHQSTPLLMNKASRELSFIPRRLVAKAIDDQITWLKHLPNKESWLG